MLGGPLILKLTPNIPSPLFLPTNISPSKGILAIALGGVLGVYMLLSDYSKLFKSNLFWIGLLIGFSPVFIWYYFQINFYGEKFIEVHFFQQNFDRLSTAVEGNKGEV